MTYLGDPQFFEETRHSLLPPRPRTMPIEYGYSVLNGRGLGGIDTFDTPPALTVTVFATKDEEVPIVFDVEHAYPWKASATERADILRIISSLHLTVPESERCTDQVVMLENRRMSRKKMAFAMLAGWSEDYPRIELQAATLTYNKRIGVNRTLDALNNSIRHMLTSKACRTFTIDTSSKDSPSNIQAFPRDSMSVDKLAIPMT